MTSQHDKRRAAMNKVSVTAPRACSPCHSPIQRRILFFEEDLDRDHGRI